MARMGKQQKAAIAKVEHGRRYAPSEALALAKDAKFAKFDETVELHIRLGVDPRHADQQVRGVVALPHGTGKQVRVLVFTEGESVKEAYHGALRVTGAAIFFTGVTLAIGVATWAFSPLNFQADVGLMLTFMFVVNMLGAMLLLPALGAWLLPRPKAPAVPAEAPAA